MEVVHKVRMEQEERRKGPTKEQVSHRTTEQHGHHRDRTREREAHHRGQSKAQGEHHMAQKKQVEH